MEEEDNFYPDEYNNDLYERNDKNDKISNDYENDKMVNICIDLMIFYEDYCKDEAIPICETLRSYDLFEFIKYGYNINN